MSARSSESAASKPRKPVNAAQRRIQPRAQALLGLRDRTRDRLHEARGVGDVINQERIHLVELAAGNLNADIVQIEAQETIGQRSHGVGADKAKGHLEVQPRQIDDTLDLAESQDDRLFLLR